MGLSVICSRLNASVPDVWNSQNPHGDWIVPSVPDVPGSAPVRVRVIFFHTRINIFPRAYIGGTSGTLGTTQQECGIRLFQISGTERQYLEQKGIARDRH